MAKIIFLIGMPAAGKSYWGDKIAGAYSLQFTDLDLFIAEQERASIAALFASYGENGFREREQKYLKQIIKKAAADTIIATGGGTPCFADNMKVMLASGTVIYLQAEIACLLHNLENSHVARPLLKGKGDMAAHLSGLLQKREKIYSQAHHILPTKDISLITFVEIISACIDRH